MTGRNYRTGAIMMLADGGRRLYSSDGRCSMTVCNSRLPFPIEFTRLTSPPPSVWGLCLPPIHSTPSYFLSSFNPALLWAVDASTALLIVHIQTHSQSRRNLSLHQKFSHLTLLLALQFITSLMYRWFHLLDPVVYPICSIPSLGLLPPPTCSAGVSLPHPTLSSTALFPSANCPTGIHSIPWIGEARSPPASFMRSTCCYPRCMVILSWDHMGVSRLGYSCSLQGTHKSVSRDPSIPFYIRFVPPARDTTHVNTQKSRDEGFVLPNNWLQIPFHLSHHVPTSIDFSNFQLSYSSSAVPIN